MKIPLNWLKQYVTTREDSASIAKKLTSIGHMLDGPIKKVQGTEVIDLEIRQNRPDCLSILGVARELSAVNKTQIIFPEIIKDVMFKPSGDWKIQIADPSLCFRFNSIQLDHIQVGESPTWLKDALINYSMEPVINVVDVTNYVMIELGQPLHAFDKKNIEGSIQVRPAKKGETFVGLNDKKYSLTNQDLVIADTQKIIALAGVMGSKTSGVQSDSSTIILEAATYNHASIRKTSLRHTIRTEASLRLEKFLHPQLTSIALCRAAYLLKEICGAEVIASVDAYPRKRDVAKISMSIARLNELGGVSLEKKLAIQILKSLEFEVQAGTSDTISVTVPYFRTDITCEEDLIEEVLRMHGYDTIPSSLPLGAVPADIQSRLYEFEEKMRDILVALTFDEHITEPLTNELTSKITPVVLQNSLTSEKHMLRTTLEGSLIYVASNYKKHKRKNIQIFEIGKIYFNEKGYKEISTLGLLVSNSHVQYSDIKGIIETLASQLGKKISSKDFFIEPVDSDTWYAELNIEKLFNNVSCDPVIVLTSPPQIVLQDLSMIAPVDLKIGEVVNRIKNIDNRIYSVSLGETPKNTNKKTQIIFLKLSFRNLDNSNITKTDIEKLRTKILSYLKKIFSMELAR